LARLTERLHRSSKPVVGCFLGAHLPQEPVGSCFASAGIIDQAVQLSLARVGAAPQELPPLLTIEERAWLDRERSAWSPQQEYLRGLFAGGTFCYQTQHVLREAGIAAYSNAPLDPGHALADPDQSREHTVVDMGDEYYTLGRPHPMIDATLRRERLLAEGRDSQVAILLLDFVLGYNAALDPVGDLLEAITEAKRMAAARSGHLTVVASICGTDGDPQDLRRQTDMLHQAGVVVFRSNAKAAAFCVELLKDR
jgi:FdrA protein